MDLLDLLHDVLDGRGDSAEREALGTLGVHGGAASLRVLTEYEPPPSLRDTCEDAVERIRNRREPVRGGLGVVAPEISGGLAPTSAKTGAL